MVRRTLPATFFSLRVLFAADGDVSRRPIFLNGGKYLIFSPGPSATVLQYRTPNVGLFSGHFLLHGRSLLVGTSPNQLQAYTTDGGAEVTLISEATPVSCFNEALGPPLPVAVSDVPVGSLVVAAHRTRGMSLSYYTPSYGLNATVALFNSPSLATSARLVLQVSRTVHLIAATTYANDEPHLFLRTRTAVGIDPVTSEVMRELEMPCASSRHADAHAVSPDGDTVLVTSYNPTTTHYNLRFLRIARENISSLLFDSVSGEYLYLEAGDLDILRRLGSPLPVIFGNGHALLLGRRASSPGLQTAYFFAIGSAGSLNSSSCPYVAPPEWAWTSASGVSGTRLLLTVTDSQDTIHVCSIVTSFTLVDSIAVHPIYMNLTCAYFFGLLSLLRELTLHSFLQPALPMCLAPSR